MKKIEPRRRKKSRAGSNWRPTESCRAQREILQRIRHGECKRVGHDAKFGRETPGGLSIHLNQHGRGINGDTVKRSGFAEMHVTRAPQLARPQEWHEGKIAPGASR